MTVPESERMTVSESERVLAQVASGDGAVLETLAQMNLDTIERSGLDERTYLLVRLAALIAMDAAPPSYLVNLAIADEVGIDLDEVRGVLVAIAPVVGSARVVSAASSAATALRMGASA
jgi:alkylhydroperoxidase/carboxymuconolactone decarboxylase family protein YurZ